MYEVVRNLANVTYFAILLLAILSDHSSIAQQVEKQFLNPHNAARARVGVAPLVWDPQVANHAERYANSHRADCKMIHSKGSYGENLAWSSGDIAISAAVKMWVDERIYYDYNSNSCAVGKICGHYTQVVWRKSKRLGCAKVRCNNGGSLISCNYDPPGNWNGEMPYAMVE